MSISFKVPIVIVFGRVNNELAVWSKDGGVSALGNIPGIGLIDELKAERQITGHVALASFGQYVIKAIDLGSKYGSYTLSEDSLIRIPTKSNVDFNKYNDWFTIRNTFILIGDPNTEYLSSYPLICPYRVGDTLFVNVGYTTADSIKAILTMLGILRNYMGRGRMSTTCMCRIPAMPLEIALIDGDKYLLIRVYLNEAQPTPGNKYLVLLTKGGNVIDKYSTNNPPLDMVVKMLNEMRSL